MSIAIDNVTVQLTELRRRYLHFRAVLLAVGGAAGLVSFLAVFIVTDWWLGWASPYRWLSWVLLWLLILGLAAGLLRTLRRRFSHSALALLAEEAWPASGNCLINAIQLAAAGHSTIAERILQENPVPSGSFPVRSLFTCREVRLPLAALGVSLLFLCLLFVAAPQPAARSFVRLFTPGSALPPHSLTRIIELTPGDIAVDRGGSAVIEVAAGGRLPASAALVWDCGDGGVRRFAMTKVAAEPESAESGRRFRVQLDNLMSASRYRVLVGDTRSPWHRIDLRQMPGLRSWRAEATPPAYTGLAPFVLTEASDSPDIPAGSAVRLHAAFSLPLYRLTVKQGERALYQAEHPHEQDWPFDFTLTPGHSEPLRLHLVSVEGAESHELLPWRVIADQPPQVEFVEPRVNRTIGRDEFLPIIFLAEDDYGVAEVELLRLVSGGEREVLGTAAAPSAPSVFSGRFMLEAGSLGAAPGERINLRLQARDQAPSQADRFGHSSILTLTMAAADERQESGAEARLEIQGVLSELIQMQRANLRLTTALRDTALQARRPERSGLRDSAERQDEIRVRARQMIELEEVFGQPRILLIGLLENEMIEATRILEPLVLRPSSRPDLEGLSRELSAAAVLQRRILAVLSGLPLALEHEHRHRQRVDLLARLRHLTEGQKLNLEATRDLLQPAVEDSPVRLARVQDRLAGDLDAFTAAGRQLLRREQEDQFGLVIRQVLDLFQQRRLYEIMITAAESLEHRELESAIREEGESLAVLLKGLDLFNQWRAETARQRLSEAAALVAEVGEALREMEKRQAEIVEVTRELAKRDSFDDDVRRELGGMDREQEAMGELVEQLAQDLYQFPELPVANELNSKMLEIFEDVQQAANSENEPAIEIAVQKEDALLDSIRETRERVEDVEMWLPDTPDNIVWNMESFDADEFPDIPLVPLPDELEDIVGDLLEQAAEIDFQAQDTTGNNIIADTLMGWDIMDGPMPNFSAKGKSGNMRPNENEMTGRSGAGREGQAVGELVEDRVKGLEGRETEARRTRDPFQQGLVEEEEASTMTARATGGGKLGGESETIGMFGQAPRRDLHLDPARASRNQMRRETEALYATARMLYLPTGGLGLAVADLRRSITETPDLPTLDARHRRVLRRLDQARVEIRDGTVLAMPVRQARGAGGAVIQDFRLDEVEEEYRQLLVDYYKSLGEE